MSMITPLGSRIFIRFARKPIWFPTAPSKLFRIADHTFYSPDEIKQIKILHTAFRAQESSIQEFMKHEFYIPATQSGGVPAEFIANEEEQDKKIYEENARENERIANLKEEVLSQQIKDLENRVLEEKLSTEDSLMETAQAIDEYIQEQMADPHSFVTRENIEEMIEKALENPVAFEYYIDLKGRRYGAQPTDDLDVPKMLIDAGKKERRRA